MKANQFREQFTSLREQVISHLISLFPKPKYDDSEYVMLALYEPITADALVADVTAINLSTDGKLSLLDGNDTDNPIDDFNDLDVLITAIDKIEKGQYIVAE